MALGEDDLVNWLFLDLNSYFASVEQNDDPRLRGRPVAVVPVMSEGTCAIAASYEAKACGIKTGTKIYEAKRLCPELVVIEARHDAYVRLHHKILEEIDRHIPVEKVCSIDEAACRLTGRQRAPDAAQAIAQAIKRGLLQNLGPSIRCSIGLAPNLYLAKIASTMEKPDGLTTLTRAGLPGPLLRLALTDLHSIARGLAARLERAGVRDVASLWALDPKQARRVWGSVEGERMWRQLRGLETVRPETVRRSLGHSHVLAPKFRDAEAGFLIARRLTMKAASRLRRLGYTTAHVVLGVRFVTGRRWAGEMRTMRTLDTLTLLDALGHLWRRMVAETAAARPRKISVTFLKLEAGDRACGDLFDIAPSLPGQNWAQRRNVSCAVDLINKRYGRDTVWFGVNPDLDAPYTGTKIAFTRIPDLAEFHE